MASSFPPGSKWTVAPKGAATAAPAICLSSPSAGHQAVVAFNYLVRFFGAFGFL